VKASEFVIDQQEAETADSQQNQQNHERGYQLDNALVFLHVLFPAR